MLAASVGAVAVFSAPAHADTGLPITSPVPDPVSGVASNLGQVGNTVEGSLPASGLAQASSPLSSACSVVGSAVNTVTGKLGGATGSTGIAGMANTATNAVKAAGCSAGQTGQAPAQQAAPGLLGDRKVPQRASAARQGMPTLGRQLNVLLGGVTNVAHNGPVRSATGGLPLIGQTLGGLPGLSELPPTHVMPALSAEPTVDAVTAKIPGIGTVGEALGSVPMVGDPLTR